MLFPKCSPAILAAVAFVYAACGGQSAEAQTTLQTELVAQGFLRPVTAKSIPGDDRIFVVEQNSGLVRIIQNGFVLGTPFLDIDFKTDDNGNEEGLLGIAFHPDFANNGFFYVNYTANGPSRSVVERYTVSATDPNVADLGSATTIISYSRPFSNHNGGDLHFGLDGYLYIPTGDGGGAGDTACNAQNPASFLGKILRLDVDSASPYAIPPTNPTVYTGAASELWAIGLRNPWRTAFDRLTGEFYIGDVGQNAFEEVDIIPATDGGHNLGWKMMEGNSCFGTGNCGAVPACNDASLLDPIFVYGHSSPFGGSCSITGGEVYRGQMIPEMFGTYFFADYCSNVILSFKLVGGVMTEQTNRTVELAPSAGGSINQITSFGVDGDGEILIVEQGGQIWRITAASQPPFADCDSNGKADDLEITMNPSLDLNSNGTLDACEPACGFTTYGVGVSPVNFIGLNGSGTAQPGSTAVLSATGVPSNPAVFFASTVSANVPVLGGVALIDLAFNFQIKVVLTAGGNATWNAPIPNQPGLVGVKAYIQAAAIDATQPGGWAMSNGVEVSICP